MASDDDDLVKPKHMNFATTGDWSNNIAPRPIARVNRRELLKLGAALTVSPSLPATAAPAPGPVWRIVDIDNERWAVNGKSTFTIHLAYWRPDAP